MKKEKEEQFYRSLFCDVVWCGEEYGEVAKGLEWYVRVQQADYPLGTKWLIIGCEDDDDDDFLLECSLSFNPTHTVTKKREK